MVGRVGALVIASTAGLDDGAEEGGQWFGVWR